MDMTKILIDAYMKPLYDGGPAGALLDAVRKYEEKLAEFAAANPGSMDLVGDSGTRDEYTRLYMAVLNGDNSFGAAGAAAAPAAAGAVTLPTVHQFLEQYRAAFDSTDKSAPVIEAYEELFNVENRTDDLIEAQLIIEKERLVLNTVTAGYKAVMEDFMKKADPNYEVTWAVTKATTGAYAEASSEEEIAYRSEVADYICADITLQLKMKVELITNFTALIFGWENSKRKIREGHEKSAEYAKAMVFTRRKVREYYRFLSEDMGISFDVIENTPFYRILLLKPEGLDELWRLKKVMHPDNIRAIKYVLFEEILSGKTMKEILMTPQPYPYYEMPDPDLHPEIGREYSCLQAMEDYSEKE